MPRFYNLVNLVLIVTLLVTLFAIHPAMGDEKITYRLKWLINMSTAGDVVAEQDGFFKAAGLDVRIKAGGPERDALRELELGYAQFGVASADQVIQALAKGSPIVVIAQLFQENPLQWIYFKDKGKLTTPADLKGKTIGVTFGKNDEYIMRTLLAKAAITDNQVKLFSVRMDYTPFYRRQVDLWPVYANTQAVEIGRKLQASGESFAFFNPADYGVRFVANSVVTSAPMMADRPQLVKKFKAALLKGWQAAMDPKNADRTIKNLQHYDRDTSKDVLAEQLKITRQLVQPATGKSIGQIDVAAWQQTERIMMVNKQIDNSVDVVRHLSIQ